MIRVILLIFVSNGNAEWPALGIGNGGLLDKFFNKDVTNALDEYKPILEGIKEVIEEVQESIKDGIEDYKQKRKDWKDLNGDSWTAGKWKEFAKNKTMVNNPQWWEKGIAAVTEEVGKDDCKGWICGIKRLIEKGETKIP